MGMSPPVSWTNRLRAALPVRRQTLEKERAARLAAEAAGARLALFADATKALTSSFDLNVVLHDLARLVAPAFADACLIDLVEPDGSIRRTATAVAPPTRRGPTTLRSSVHRTGTTTTRPRRCSDPALRRSLTRRVTRPWSCR